MLQSACNDVLSLCSSVLNFRHAVPGVHVSDFLYLNIRAPLSSSLSIIAFNCYLLSIDEPHKIVAAWSSLDGFLLLEHSFCVAHSFFSTSKLYAADYAYWSSCRCLVKVYLVQIPTLMSTELNFFADIYHLVG